MSTDSDGWREQMIALIGMAPTEVEDDVEEGEEKKKRERKAAGAAFTWILLLTSKFRLACPLLLSFLPLHPLLLTTLFLQAPSKRFFEPPLPPKTICVLVLFHIFWHFKIYPREVLA